MQTRNKGFGSIYVNLSCGKYLFTSGYMIFHIYLFKPLQNKSMTEHFLGNNLMATASLADKLIKKTSLIHTQQMFYLEMYLNNCFVTPFNKELLVKTTKEPSLPQKNMKSTRRLLSPKECKTVCL